MSAQIALVFLLLFGQADPLSTSRRLMLEGELSTAIQVLESLLEEDSPDRVRAGFLLEISHQLLLAYSAESLSLLTPEAEDRLAPTDTMTIDGELMLLVPRLEQLLDAEDVPFPLIEPGTPSARSVYLREIWDESSLRRGVLAVEIQFAAPAVSGGDSVRVWVPLAAATASQDPDEPTWEIDGINTIETSVIESREGILPCLFIEGTISGDDGFVIGMEQGFSLRSSPASPVDPSSVVLPVPGSSPEVDRNLASTQWVDASSHAFITAREAAGSEPNPVYKADSVLLYVLGSVRMCQVPAGPVIAEGLSRATRRMGCGDSAGVSALLAALCRALGIPARVGAGLLDSPSGAVYTCFTELMFESETWIHVDPVLMDLGMDYLDSRLPSLADPIPGGVPMVRTCVSIEDTLSPSKDSWTVTLPGSIPEVEVRSQDGYWRAVPLDQVIEAAVTEIRWQ